MEITDRLRGLKDDDIDEREMGGGRGNGNDRAIQKVYMEERHKNTAS